MSTPVVGQPIAPEDIREGMTIEARKPASWESSYQAYAAVVLDAGPHRSPLQNRLILQGQPINRWADERYTFTLLADVPRPDWRDAPAGSRWQDPETGLWVRVYEGVIAFRSLSAPLTRGTIPFQASERTLDHDSILARLVPAPGSVYDNGEWREGK